MLTPEEAKDIKLKIVNTYQKGISKGRKDVIDELYFIFQNEITLDALVSSKNRLDAWIVIKNQLDQVGNEKK